MTTTLRWITPACPLCGAHESEEVFTHENTLFGAGVRATMARCACGMLLTSPRPADECLGALYDDDSYYTHAAKTGARARMRRRLRAAQLRGVGSWARRAVERATGRRRYAMRWAPGAFTLPRGARFLDFGCGGGQNLELAAALGMDAMGVEPDPKARAAAGARGCRCVTSVDDTPDGWRADRLLLSHVLEHLPEPVATLRRLAGVSRPGARWLIRVPNAASWQAEACGAFWIGYDMPRHLWHFTGETLRRTLASAGLDVTEIRTVELAEFFDESVAQAHKAGAPAPSSREPARPLERAGRGAELLAIARTHAHRGGTG